MENITVSDFIKRRSKLTAIMRPASAVIISANRLMPKSYDQYFKFRQSTHFYYLTGIDFPDCTLVLIRLPSGGSKELIFINGRDLMKDRWVGPGLDKEKTTEVSGVTDIRYNSELDFYISDVFSEIQYLYFGQDKYVGKSIFPGNEFEIRQAHRGELDHLKELRIGPLLAKLRSIKSPAEIAMHRKANELTKDAFLSITESIHPGGNEADIEARLSYEFRKRGVLNHAFDPIIACGKNALTLHYTKNDSELKAGELLLMDFGAEWEYYAADISRTLPVSGKFTSDQKQYYNACLRVMKKAMSLFKPGITLKDIHLATGSFWEEEHILLGLYSLEESRRADPEKPLWREFYWHSTSHSIGLDAHDPFDDEARLEKGMILSCEPGIYVKDKQLGIRLENDILITEDGCENLSRELPVEIEALEELLYSS